MKKRFFNIGIFIVCRDYFAGKAELIKEGWVHLGFSHLYISVVPIKSVYSNILYNSCDMQFSLLENSTTRLKACLNIYTNPSFSLLDVFAENHWEFSFMKYRGCSHYKCATEK